MNVLVMSGMAVVSVALLGAAFYMYFRLAPRKEEEEVMTDRVSRVAAAPDVSKAVARDLIPGESALAATLNKEIRRAGLHNRPDHMKLAMILAAAVVLSTAWLGGAAAAISIAAALLLFSGLLIRHLQARLRRTVTHQLPEFLEQIIRALAAGNTLETALEAAVQESEDPVRGLFASVVRQLKLGAPLDEVVGEVAELHDIKDLHVIAMSAKVNRKYGGSLRRLLKVLITSIHQRERAEAELKALTGETRVSAFVLVLIPMSIIGFVLVNNPGYYQDAWADSFGRAMLVSTIVLQLIGAVVIFRMMKSTGGDSL